MIVEKKEAPAVNDLKSQHLKKSLLKMLALIPIALLGWLLAMNDPKSAVIVPAAILIGGAAILALDGYLGYRSDRRAGHS